MKGLIFATTVVAVLFAFGGTADAGHKHYGHSHSQHSHHGHGVQFRFGGYPIYASPIAPVYHPPVYHDTTHYDYHAPSVYRHGNHYHVAPGHYDLHRSGHWHD